MDSKTPEDPDPSAPKDDLKSKRLSLKPGGPKDKDSENDDDLPRTKSSLLILSLIDDTAKKEQEPKEDDEPDLPPRSKSKGSMLINTASFHENLVEHIARKSNHQIDLQSLSLDPEVGVNTDLNATTPTTKTLSPTNLHTSTSTQIETILPPKSGSISAPKTTDIKRQSTLPRKSTVESGHDDQNHQKLPADLEENHVRASSSSLGRNSRKSKPSTPLIIHLDLIPGARKSSRRQSVLVMEHQQPDFKASSSPSWEEFIAKEMGMDPEMMKSHGKQKNQKKIKIEQGLVADIKWAHVDKKKQHEFMEEVLASYYMKELTNRFGSKGKSPKQYFMEAYDTDTTGGGAIQEDENGVKLTHKRFDYKGREIAHIQKKTECPAQTVEELGDIEGRKSPPCSPIVFRSLLDIFGDSGDAEEMDDYEDDEVQNFWAELEKTDPVEEIESDILGLRTCSSGSDLDQDELKGPSQVPSESGVNKISFPIQDEDEENKAIITMMKGHTLDKYLEKIQEVVQSAAVSRCWDNVLLHLSQLNTEDPLAYNLYGETYEEIRNFVKLPEEDAAEFEAGNWAPNPFPEHELFQLEPQEKLFSRFSIYQKALLYLADHFEALRPLITEIKQSYEDVLERCDREWSNLDKFRLRQLWLKKRYAAYVRHKDKVGDRAMIKAKLQAYALQQQIQWQQHTLNIILGMLWKMRQSLKMQSHLVKKTSVKYKSKVEALAKEIVSDQGQNGFEMTLAGKYTEMVDKFKSVKDPKEVRRILLSARLSLRKIHRRIVIFEADYSDTVPKTDYLETLEEFNLIYNKNQEVVQKCDELRAEIQKLKDSIAEKNKSMFDSVGLDETTGEKPIIYLQPLGFLLTVPAYLRYAQQVIDLKYTIAEASILVKEVWTQRIQLVDLVRRIKKARDDEAEGASNYPDDLPYNMPELPAMGDFLAEYFLKKESNLNKRMELSYNLVAACRRLDDQELSLFIGIVDGIVDESVYHLWHLELERIKEKVDDMAYEQKDNKGYLGFGDFIKYLQEIAPKSETEVKLLTEAAMLVSEAKGDWAMVPVNCYFECKDLAGGRENDFVSVLHQQFEDGRKFYIHEILTCLLLELGISEKLLENVDDPAWLTDVSMHVFYASVVIIDPEISSDALAQFLSWIYLGISSLAGVITLGAKLVEFLRERAHFAYYELEKYNEEDDLDFEDCITQIKQYDEDESTMDKLDLKKRRLRTKKLKYASLRQLYDRLNSGPFVRQGKRPIVNDLTDFLAIEEEEEEMEEVTTHRRHRHHHRHGKKSRRHRHRGKQGLGDDQSMMNMDNDLDD